MTNQQEAPEALRLADSLELCWGDSRLDEAAAELRRLHAENVRLAALVEAQQPAPSAAAMGDVDLPDAEEMAHSAVQEALSFGLSHDVIHRWMRHIQDQTVKAMLAAPKPSPSPATFPRKAYDDVQQLGGAWPSLSTAPAGIYVASRASVPERPARWRALRDAGWPIVSTWIDEAGPGETDDLGELWGRITREVASAQGVLLHVEPDDFPLKGALIEVGMALSLGKRVGVYAPGVELEERSMRPLGSWASHPLVYVAPTLQGARCWVEETADTSPAPAQPGQEGERTISLPRLGVVPLHMAESKGIEALERMAASVCVIDDMACWDHLAMFDVRDALVDADRAARAAPQPATADAVDAQRWRWIAAHWKTVNFKFDRHTQVLSGLSLTVDATKTGMGAPDIEREIDAALTAQREVKP